jgi:hypothetical protein
MARLFSRTVTRRLRSVVVVLVTAALACGLDFVQAFTSGYGEG